MRNIFTKQRPTKKDKAKAATLSHSCTYSLERNDLLKEGYMLMQSRSFLRLQSDVWKYRYFVILNNTLCIYKRRPGWKFNSSRVSPYKQIITLDDTVGIYPETLSRDDKKFVIRITKGRKDITLCAQSEEERNSWLSALLTAVTNNIVKESPGSSDSLSEEENRKLEFESLQSQRINRDRFSWTSSTLLEREADMSLHMFSTNMFKAQSMYELDRKRNPRYSFVIFM